MSETRTYLIQLWHDSKGTWAVLKDEAGNLRQFENLETLTRFLTDAPGPRPPQGQPEHWPEHWLEPAPVGAQ